MPAKSIKISGARQHNLKNLHVEIPREKLVVITGLSGSGKSSLAFDVVFAEGQRRFMETLSPYARQFLPTLPRPDVDSVTGVPPSIALEQRTPRGGAHSTGATGSIAPARINVGIGDDSGTGTAAASESLRGHTAHARTNSRPIGAPRSCGSAATVSAGRTRGASSEQSTSSIIPSLRAARR